MKSPTSIRNSVLSISMAILGLTISAASLAQVKVNDAWVRATVGPQKVTGAFMQITSSSDSKLVSAQADVAGRVEIHTMEMDKDVMKMREIPSLDLPANKTVELKPGSFHIMLFDLKNPVKDGDVVDLNLIVENKDKKRETIKVKAVAKAMNKAAPNAHGDHKM